MKALLGAEGGNRTPMMSPSLDFESRSFCFYINCLFHLLIRKRLIFNQLQPFIHTD
ncbi:hypothetical protein SAMN05216325_11811 [Nitrosomonas marina]|uniref:Uncharacterized protein n=1 Tax=Nitrosomonas marina TaxID=917 RepID=A0A1H8GGY9_9PROT|nr:hypothetical protein SAMN05216325_11811 [Nitrosomonas marina]